MGCGASKNTVDTTKNEMKQAGQSTSNLKLPLNHPCIVFVLGGILN